MHERLAPLQDGAMSPEHKIALAKINAYFGAPPAGPFAVWAHQAGAAEGCFQIFLAHRHEDKLERRLFELAVVIVARNWSADFPWTSHAPAALRLGVGPDVVAAIELGKTPTFVRDDERATYDLITELTRERRVRQETYDKAIAVLGAGRVIALVNAAGFYAMVSISTVAFETPLVEKLGKPVRLAPLAGLPTAAFDPEPPSGKARLAELDYDSLAPAQRGEVAKVRAHFDRAPVGPFQVWAHQPGVANGAFQLYLTHRYETTLDRGLMELMTITVARSWGSQFVWASHARQAAENGVGRDIIEAIRVGDAPPITNAEDRAVYEITHELCAHRKISDATFGTAAAILGTPRLVALVNGVSFYTMICMAVVAFDMPASDGTTLLPPLAGGVAPP